MSRYFALFLLVLTAPFSGCGGKSDFAVNYVEGTVTLDGTPLANAVVSFSPVKGGTGKAAVGTTDAKGVFKLTATENNSIGGGAAAGDYEVSITKAPDAPAAVDPDAWKTDPNYGKDNKEMHSKTVEVKSEVPPGYRSTTTSGLTATIKPGKNTDIKFELKKSFAPKT